MKENVAASEARAPHSGEKNPGLYLHVPFCRSKCDYCSFNSRPWAGKPPDDYLAALIREAEVMAAAEWAASRTFDTFFIGGGTPTIYGAAPLSRLISACLAAYRFIPAPEITIETNPNTVDLATLKGLRAAGVNRLSIGVQSFSDRLLRAIGRTHSAAEAVIAFQAGRQAGFDNISLDLIFGLPGQTGKDLEASLKEALRLNPDHLALYELMLEEGALLTRKVEQGEVTLPTGDEVADMAGLAGELLAEAGYERYEISNFSRPGRECRHNLNYWRNGIYLGLGAGAVSCLSGLRLRNVEDAGQYVTLVNQGIPPYLEGEFLALAPRFRETVIMGLRMTRGVSLADLAARFALTPAGYYGKTMERLQNEGLLEMSEGFMRLTTRGLPVANQILVQLV